MTKLYNLAFKLFIFEFMRLFLYFFLILFAISPIVGSADDDDDQNRKATSKFSQTYNGQAVVVLDKTQQIVAGLKTIKLKSVAYRSELLSYGSAVSIESLMILQNQYQTALAQQSSAKAKTVFSQNNLNRLAYLHHEQIIASRVLQEQQALAQVDKAMLDSSHYVSQQIMNNARLQWGNILTDWMISSDASFTALMQQRKTLLKINFPANVGITHPLKTIFVAPNGQRGQAIAAELISAVPQADSFSQMQQYFYQVPSQQIKAGMRVSAWIPTQQQTQTGVIIPESAVCWHLGQALVFLKVAQQQFSHRVFASYRKISEGYFVYSSLKAGDEIVSVGAQMLLSQEFKGQIPDEDDD
jgi:hypothetical protein